MSCTCKNTCKNEPIKIFTDEVIEDVNSKIVTINSAMSVGLQVTKTDADGTPIITIEASNDKTNWSSETIGVSIDTDTKLMAVVNFRFKYFRLKLEKNDCTTGTLTALLMLKSL